MITLERASVVAPALEAQVTLLEPTTLQLAEQRISIIGSNGSGKSTLARLLNGLIVPSSGSVHFRVPSSEHRDQAFGAHHNPESNSPNTSARTLDTAKDGAKVRRHVGFVFTDPSAQLVMPTAIEDISLSLRRSHPNKQARLEAARAALCEFGLGEFADRSVHTLSGGQKQLLAIAAVLAARPTILVADEPTTLLDLRNSLRVRELLMSLPQQVIVATHDLELAAQAQRTLVLAHARIVFDGTPDAAIDYYRSSVAAGS